MDQIKIFVVDDESSVRISLSDDLKDLGFIVYDYGNPLEALIDLTKLNPDLIFSDIRMPELNGIDFLKEIKKISPNTFVVMMTGFSSVNTAVEAVKSGAYDYISKPLNIEEIKIIIKQISGIISLKYDYQRIIEQSSENYNLDNIIGSSIETQNLKEAIKMVSSSDTTILIQGETGIGKELVSNVIHYSSNRRDKPLIKLSCAILSKEIFESELFGHDKGAFTGAVKDKKGRFELANNGTLFLDDIDDIPFELQVKLLRVLEENEFEKVGGEKTIKVNVRIIAATKKDLRKLVEEGKFREDLYYRLNVFPIKISPLREHKIDIKELFWFFLKKLVNLNNFRIQDGVFEILEQYNWPGNIRELKHLVERLVILSSGTEIKVSHLPQEIMNFNNHALPDFQESLSLDGYLNEVEKNILTTTLAKTAGNKSKAAEILKIPYSTLRTKLEKYGL
ncbi:sigma-54-dependent Fis family transcriptional regulator [Bacteroidetes/Chlorobi group bacterium ChocPot_Mid]|jgi:DNA-binding NtrC family response regulator|nr:MAG: sigma-54-dependent Fis family transcriptional regulator [Bacteroidetes/Chlorobi group bacterium ChocPot_Mid]